VKKDFESAEEVITNLFLFFKLKPTLMWGRRHFICILALSLTLGFNLEVLRLKLALDFYSSSSSGKLANRVELLSSKETVKEKLASFSTNKMTFVTICNKGMAVEWLQQWYVSARRAGIVSILVVATDDEAYEWIRLRLGEDVIPVSALVPLLSSERWRNEQNSSHSEQAFNWRSKGYERVVTQRATIISSLLENTGGDILYADTDIHWLKNPQKLISNSYSKYHFCIQREMGDELGDYNCSGFMYFRNTPITRQFVRVWEGFIKRRLMIRGFFTDQEEINKVLTDLKRRRSTQYNVSSLRENFKACTFDWDEFPSGINYFKIREKGKGKITRTCQSKSCKYLVWSRINSNHEVKKGAFLVHHNFAKKNEVKVSRAKEYNLWLELGSADWNNTLSP